jgi:hypothetical protein
MKSFKKIIISIFVIICFIANTSAETLEDLANELNTIKNEIANLEPTPINNPILPVIDKSGKAVTGMIVSSSGNSKVVTYVEVGKYGSKPKTGIILSETNAKDIAAYQTAKAAAELAAEQVSAQASIDKALNELNDATSFMQENISKGDI